MWEAERHRDNICWVGWRSTMLAHTAGGDDVPDVSRDHLISNALECHWARRCSRPSWLLRWWNGKTCKEKCFQKSSPATPVLLISTATLTGPLLFKTSIIFSMARECISVYGNFKVELWSKKNGRACSHPSCRLVAVVTPLLLPIMDAATAQRGSSLKISSHFYIWQNMKQNKRLVM